MDDPSKQNDPEHSSKHKHDDCAQEPTLQQLPKAGHKQTTQRSDHISG